MTRIFYVVAGWWFLWLQPDFYGFMVAGWFSFWLQLDSQNKTLDGQTRLASFPVPERFRESGTGTGISRIPGKFPIFPEIYRMGAKFSKKN